MSDPFPAHTVETAPDEVRPADMLAMHLLARSQGVATLASSFHDEGFIRQEVEQMYAWLEVYTQKDASRVKPHARKKPPTAPRRSTRS